MSRNSKAGEAFIQIDVGDDIARKLTDLSQGWTSDVALLAEEIVEWNRVDLLWLLVNEENEEV